MQYDKELIAHKLDRWDRFITDYHLPEWDAIPDLGLYMDQVVVLLAQYLLTATEDGQRIDYLKGYLEVFPLEQ